MYIAECSVRKEDSDIEKNGQSTDFLDLKLRNIWSGGRKKTRGNPAMRLVGLMQTEISFCLINHFRVAAITFDALKTRKLTGIGCFALNNAEFMTLHRAIPS